MVHSRWVAGCMLSLALCAAPSARTATNLPPTVSIGSPATGASFAAPASITISAMASDADGSVSKVEFFEGATKLGEDTSRPYRFTWDNVPAGTYALSARATDDLGASNSSAAVNIVVTNGPGPEVTISSPTNGTVLAAPATFSVQASISGGIGNISQVEFFNGTQSLGVDTGNPYRVTVSNLPAGSYTLSAVGTDTLGRTGTNRITLMVNALPTVTITSPADGAGLIAPATFPLQASASDADGSVMNVQYLRGTTALGTVNTNPSSLMVKGLGVGNYTFRAVATDDLGGTAADSVNLLVKHRPTLTVNTPASGARLTNAVTPMTGKAADSVGVARVDYSVNGAAFVPATGTTNWTAPLALPPGTNVVRSRSVDVFSNVSLTNTRSVFQVVPSALTLSLLGTGTVSGATNGQVLEVARGYQLTATPGPGFLFSNWTGHASSVSSTLRFLMRSNMALRANFVPNPFLRVSGAFNGLFHETNHVRWGSSGDFRLALTPSGKYTASLRLAGRRHTTSGRLDLEGRATNVILRLGTNALTVHWAVDLHGLDQVTGSVSDGQWVAPLLGDRAVFHALTNPAPLAGRHTVVLPGSDAPGEPAGDGWGTLVVFRGGLGVLAGSLADGSPFARSVPISKDGTWPLWAPLYLLRGSILGWVHFDTNAPSDDLRGVVDWIKPALPETRLYPGGFHHQTVLTGSRYQAPTNASLRVLDLTNAVLELSGGNLSQTWPNEVVLGSTRVTNAGPHRLAVTLSPASGVFRGSFTDTNVSRTVKFSGAVLQKPAVGAGYFVGTNLSGRVRLLSAP